MRTPDKATWLRVVNQAHDGDARHLLELLLRPAQMDGQGKPLPDGFYDLPDDQDLRTRIVWALLHGPWREADFTLDDLMMKTGWGTKSKAGTGKKPRISDFEIDMAALYLDAGATPDEFADLAEAHALDPGYLRKLIRARKKAR